MLYLIGLGLQDEDIAQRGIEVLENSDVAYAELYTNAIQYDLTALEERTGTPITVLERSQVEEDDQVLTAARQQDVAFLVSGDPLTATTHQDILFRARKDGVETDIIHAPSILTAVAETGLSIYKFGRITTLPAPYKGRIPDSPFEVINTNRSVGLHTLMLLDIGMTADEALEILNDRLASDTELLVAAELGTNNRNVRVGAVNDLSGSIRNMGVPCSVIVPGNLSDNEKERLQTFKR